MDTPLREQVRDRLVAEGLEPGTAALVLAACDGDGPLDACLTGTAHEARGVAPREGAIPRVWLRSLTVEGFRGVADPLTLDFDGQPGLVVIAGRNGSGKSTLAEALDALLTGRGEAREGGWVHLHHAGPRRVRATFATSGRERPVEVERRFGGSGLGRSELLVDGAPVDDLALFGGVELLRAWRPVLSCGELGRKVEDRPSDLHDALASGLGLEALTDARDRLKAAERERTKRVQEAFCALGDLRAGVAGVDEPWAARCAEVLAGEDPDPDALERALAEAGEEPAARRLGRPGAWRPVGEARARWIESRRGAELAAAEADRLGRAERWLRDAELDLRDERFAPLRDEALRWWASLRQDGRVELDVALSGGRARRKLELRARVDGVTAEARSVMSQGELSALSLALFLPRTVLPDSPFRFVVVDDPVQAMDSRGVDGLARALGELARRRQAIVLTHDERLVESLRAQRIPTTVWALRRHGASKVELTT